MTSEGAAIIQAEFVPGIGAMGFGPRFFVVALRQEFLGFFDVDVHLGNELLLAKFGVDQVGDVLA